jgi:hypothetical protein
MLASVPSDQVRRRQTKTEELKLVGRKLSERTLAEMERGRNLTAHRALSARFNPDHDDTYNESEGARPADEETKRYQQRLREMNKDRWGD